MPVRHCVAILIGLFALAGLAQAQENIAVIIKISGDVFITPEGSTRSDRARKGQVLNSGDKIETSKDALCAIKFLDDRSLLRIRENSSCVVEGKKKGNSIDKNVFAEVGDFFASLFRPRGRFQFTTPTSVASVKGTRFWVLQRGATGGTTYITTEGVVEVENSAGKVLVREGQTAEVASRTRQPLVRLTRADEIPSDEEAGGPLRTIDVEFQNANGETKVLRIQVQE